MRRAAEFQAVYSLGNKRQSASFSLFVLKNNLPYSRFGITTSRKLGSAPVRNRIRRRTRELLRKCSYQVPVGCDVVVNPRSAVASRPFRDLLEEVRGLLERHAS